MHFSLPAMLEVTPHIRIPLDEFEFTYSRSSGPGGQNVNKVNSKAQLRWKALASPSLPPDVLERLKASFGSRITTEGEILIVSQKYRDQPKNVADCLEKLRAMLASVARPKKKRRPTKPTLGSKKRRLNDKKAQSQRKSERGWKGE